jgi:hypothetical protein
MVPERQLADSRISERRCQQMVDKLSGCRVTPEEWQALQDPCWKGSLRLIPMLQWLDSTHVAKVHDRHPAMLVRSGLNTCMHVVALARTLLGMHAAPTSTTGTDSKLQF